MYVISSPTLTPFEICFIYYEIYISTYSYNVKYTIIMGKSFINLLVRSLALFAGPGAILSDGGRVTTAICINFTFIPLIYAGLTCEKSDR